MESSRWDGRAGTWAGATLASAGAVLRYFLFLPAPHSFRHPLCPDGFACLTPPRPHLPRVLAAPLSPEASALCHVPLSNTCGCDTQNSVTNSCIQRVLR